MQKIDDFSFVMEPTVNKFVQQAVLDYKKGILSSGFTLNGSSLSSC